MMRRTLIVTTLFVCERNVQICHPNTIPSNVRTTKKYIFIRSVPFESVQVNLFTPNIPEPEVLNGLFLVAKGLVQIYVSLANKYGY